jgi:hypothetical protein
MAIAVIIKRDKNARVKILLGFKGFDIDYKLITKQIFFKLIEGMNFI